MIRFECRVCGGEVLQRVDERGLPDRPDPCRHCEKATERAIAVLRARDQLETGVADR
jgi:hypothetical protein